MHGQNIGDNQPIVVPTTQWSDQGLIDYMSMFYYYKL